MFMYPMFPMFIPADYHLPPTLYSILNSLVNFDNDNPVKIKNLASAGREYIFDFTYPLSYNASKEDFECMILNHFMMRRIGYDTVTAFKLALNVKLNEIMPMYNKLFDSIVNWDIFDDGEVVTRTVTDSRSINEIGNVTNNNSLSSTDTSDRRNSELPQSEIINVQNGSYMTDYNYDTNTSNSISNSTSNNSNSSSNSGTLSENIRRTPADKMKNYQEFIQAKQNIMTMIFKDLDVLFYGLV